MGAQQQANSQNSVPHSHGGEEVAATLEAATGDAVAILHAGLFEGPPSTRIRAAVAILNFGAIAAENRDLDRRITELERVKWKKSKPL